MKTKEPKGKRKELRDNYGFDVKFAYHVVRLLDEAEQILTTGDLDLGRNREQLKAIRRGDMTEEEIRRWASDKEAHLENVYNESSLRHGPDESGIRRLLMNCLEEHYGNLEKCVVDPDATTEAT